ncbi:MAG: lysophospholipid acyltransferase family protein [Gammaproteobacteria bacterium]|nr:lysophospholipid acyltransferase family protein [Gammaproteobacteria bacterium]
MSTILTKLSLRLLSLFSLSTHHRIGKLLGYLLFIFKNRNKHIAQVNIGICFPNLSAKDKEKLLRNSLEENGKTLLECFWLWKHPQQVLSSLLGSIENQHLLKRASSQGSIFVTPHFGSWEFIGLLTASSSDLLILYAPPKSKQVGLLSYQGRGSTGGTVISTDELNVKHMIRHIKNGGSVGILPDQVPDGNGGVYSAFFKRKAYTSTLVCKLAKKLQCPVVFCYALRSNEIPLKYNAYYYDAPNEIYSDDISLGTDTLNKCIEKFIRAAPEQYIWGYKRFKRPAADDNYPY